MIIIDHNYIPICKFVNWYSKKKVIYYRNKSKNKIKTLANNTFITSKQLIPKLRRVFSLMNALIKPLTQHPYSHLSNQPPSIVCSFQPRDSLLFP